MDGHAQLIAARAEDIELRADASEIVEAASTASRYVEARARARRIRPPLDARRPGA